MKKFVIVFLVVIMLAGCSGDVKQPKTSDILDKIKTEIKLPEMPEISIEQLAENYVVDAKIIDESSHIMSAGELADEILIVKLKNVSDVDGFVKQCEKYKQLKQDDFVSYNISEVPKIKASVILSKDKYVLFAVCDNSSRAGEIFSGEF